jgi:cytochrome oxidase Cu insertion factor (SCO1/SenC/PrrC family)
MNKFLLSLRRLPMIILAGLLVISTGCQAPGEQSAFDPSVSAAPVKGARAPDFTLTDLDGDEVSLSDLRGQPVLLNFWTTW